LCLQTRYVCLLSLLSLSVICVPYSLCMLLSFCWFSSSWFLSLFSPFSLCMSLSLLAVVSLLFSFSSYLGLNICPCAAVSLLVLTLSPLLVVFCFFFCCFFAFSFFVFFLGGESWRRRKQSCSAFFRVPALYGLPRLLEFPDRTLSLQIGKGAVGANNQFNPVHPPILESPSSAQPYWANTSSQCP